MKNNIFSAAIVLMSVCLPWIAGARDVQGILYEVEGQPVIRVWGNHYDRGYAQGYLLSDEAMTIFESYILFYVSPQEYNLLYTVYELYFEVPEDFTNEAQGFIDGAAAALDSIYVEALERDLTARDLAIGSSIPDVRFLTDKIGADFRLCDFYEAPEVIQCSSLTGWGAGTANDPDVNGDLIHGRNLDWNDTPQHHLSRNTIVVASYPYETDEQPWCSISFPGLLGTLSGMNESGVGVTLNMGNHGTEPSVPPKLTPVMMSMRKALQFRDLNGDDLCTIDDVYEAIDSSARAWTYINHCFSPVVFGDSKGICSQVVESNSQGIAVRIHSDDPDLSPNFLAATNHHRTLYPPVSCWRYELISSMIMEDYQVDTEEVISILEAVRQGSYTIHKMVFRPSLKDFFLSYLIDDPPGAYTEPAHIEWDDLFPETPYPTVTAVPTETATPLPTSIPEPTATPQPTATNIPDSLGVELILNQERFTPGDLFDLQEKTFNPGNQRPTLLFCILEVVGIYFFHPDWTEDVSWEEITLEPGITTHPILSFQWPNVEDTLDHILFWGAMLEPDAMTLLGDYDCVEWGYGPE